MNPSSLRYTLCFLTRGSQVLMLHRNRPPNQGLWNGVGGHIEAGETPPQACLREVREETGFELDSAYFGGLLTWQGFEIPSGGLYLFTAPAPAGAHITTDEGELDWKERDWVCTSPDVVSNIHHFLPLLLATNPPRVYHFTYAEGRLQNWEIQSLPETFRVDDPFRPDPLHEV